VKLNTAAPTVRAIISLLLNLFAALMATSLAQSPFVRLIHFSPPYRAAMLRADAVISFVAFGMGFAVYLRWRPKVSKWLWLAGVSWYLPRTLLTFIHSRSPFPDGAYEGGLTYQDIVAWVEFTVPCLRLVFYSAGAYCCARLLSRSQACPARKILENQAEAGGEAGPASAS
jgi:hypothetical protein